MIASKPVIGISSTIGIIGSGALAYKMGVFGKRETSTTKIEVRQQLKDQGYELINESNNPQEQWKISFNAFKNDNLFLQEINKHTENKEILTSQSDENKGKSALEKLCNSYLKGSNDFENASKWCVLRIQDKNPAQGWLPLVDESEKTTENQRKWGEAFEKHKSLLVKENIEGIIDGTQKTDGYAKLRKWCTDNLPLPFNNKRQTIFINASTWCAASN